MSRGSQRLRTRVKKKATTHSANPECSDGIAATGFDMACPTLSSLPAVPRPMASQPRPDIRSTCSAIYPYLDAHHGGAAGYRKYVARPAAVSANQRRMNAAHSARRRTHSTTATAKLATKCEK